jgi:hypothetical protein
MSKISWFKGGLLKMSGLLKSGWAWMILGALVLGGIATQAVYAQRVKSGTAPTIDPFDPKSGSTLGLPVRRPPTRDPVRPPTRSPFIP